MKELLKQLGFEHLPMLSEFVWALQQDLDTYSINHAVSYTEFVKHPLTKGMFIPCGLDGEVLEKPERYELWLAADKLETMKSHWECGLYQQAKEKVLFEGDWTIREEYGVTLIEIAEEAETMWFDEEAKRFSDGERAMITIEDAINNGVKLKLK